MATDPLRATLATKSKRRAALCARLTGEGDEAFYDPVEPPAANGRKPGRGGTHRGDTPRKPGRLRRSCGSAKPVFAGSNPAVTFPMRWPSGFRAAGRSGRSPAAPSPLDQLLQQVVRLQGAILRLRLLGPGQPRAAA